MAAMQLTRMHRVLIGVVVAGAVIIAAIGFAGSYAAVRELAEKKGFGDFSLVFPIGIDAGICVLLALDLLLTWLRIPFPLLRQTAWLLTAATIAFNGAAAWPDPLGVGMHAVIPMLFVVAVEAARHAVGRIADITADKHMEGVRLTRWLLSPVPTFRLWRRMKLWELRSYEQVIKLEQDRLIYQARLQARFGRGWRRKAPVEALMPLRLAKYGVPLAETAPAGLAAAGVEPMLLPPNPVAQETPAPLAAAPVAELPQAASAEPRPAAPVQQAPQQAAPAPQQARAAQPAPDGTTAQTAAPAPAEAQAPTRTAAPTEAQTPAPGGQQAQPQPHPGPTPHPQPEPAPRPQPHPQTQEHLQPQEYPQPQEHLQPQEYPQTQEHLQPQEQQPEPAPQPHAPQPEPHHTAPANHVSPWFSAPTLPQDTAYAGSYDPAAHAEEADRVPEAEEDEYVRAAYEAFQGYVGENGNPPSADALALHLTNAYGLQHPRAVPLLRRLLPDFITRYQAELEAEHIA
ncbi:DUF2637 domain-containing protein [Streptomyces roseolilacinus]|uniref:DUF2637 domain-containing protein n=1 Tax=Streptomyces roseolilacinus TaxID=66904 RepID=A0A918EHY4_9ACTN|nr:DUF2637 domain-containing protein [Streptomyces roseolilacinus]GGP92675.1 hypothetical protein GCM10010249_08470 [Streptomyces roseolilacinus]